MAAQALRVWSNEASEAEPGDCRPIDLVHLSRQTLGDRDLEMELLALFERQAVQIMGQIDAIGGGSDRRSHHDLAHTLKGSARAVGATAVALMAQRYEDALCRGGTNGELHNAAQALGCAVVKAVDAIQLLLRDR